MRSLFTNVSGGLEAFLSIISLILIFVLILILAYYVTKFAAKYQSNILNQKSNISIIESFRLGNNRFIAIVKIADNYYALGIGKDEMTFIDKLDSDFFNNLDNLSKNNKNMIFKDVLSKIKNNKSSESDDYESKDDF